MTNTQKLMTAIGLLILVYLAPWVVPVLALTVGSVTVIISLALAVFGIVGGIMLIYLDE